jgi:sarcosine oxidase subunit beta
MRVVVIGAGALGLCTAHELLERGVGDVTVLDARHVAGASSGLSVGIVETQYLDPLAIEIRVWSMRAFARLERERDLRVVRNGYLRLAHTEEQRHAFERSAELQHELGVADAGVLDRDAVAALVPDMRTDDVVGGLFGPSDGYIDGHLYCGLLADWIGERGGVVRPATAVERHEASGGRHRLLTSGSPLDCDVVVNAAGGWAGEVGELLGAPVEVLPERHQALHVRLPHELPYRMPSVMDYVPASGALGLYFRDEGPGRLIAGLHTEEAVEHSVDALTFTEQVAERFADRLPALAGAGLGDVWSGVYPMSPHGAPVVGPAREDPSIVTVAGAGGSGLQSSPALGAIAADWIVHGEPRTIPAARSLAP